MKETINYIINKYFSPIKEKIDYAVSVLENSDTYSGGSYGARNIIESIRDNNLANLEREIEAGFPSFKALEEYLPNYLGLGDIEKDFEIMYDTIELSICDFLDSGMENKKQVALNNLSDLDKKIENYQNSLLDLQDMKTPKLNDLGDKVETKEKAEYLNEILDEVDSILDNEVDSQLLKKDIVEERKDDYMENSIKRNDNYSSDVGVSPYLDSTFVSQSDRNNNYKSNDEEYYNVEEFLNNISNSNEHYTETEEDRKDIVDKYIGELEDIQSKYDEDFNNKYLKTEHPKEVSEEKYTKELSDYMDQLNGLYKTLGARTRKFEKCKEAIVKEKKRHEETITKLNMELYNCQMSESETRVEIEKLLRELYSSNFDSSILSEPSYGDEGPKKRI